MIWVLFQSESPWQRNEAITWIIWTLTCEHKIWGKNSSNLRPYLKAFPVFNVLETCRVYLLTIDLGTFNLWKNLSSGFVKNAKFVGVDQITSKNCNKSSWMQVKKFFLLAIAQSNSPLFWTQFSMESNHYEMKPPSKAYHFLKKLSNCVDSMLFHCLYDA